MAVQKTYTEEQKTEAVDLAQVVGIGRAIRDLGYPTWPSLMSWCKARGVQPAVDTVMQEARKLHTFMENNDALVVAEAVFARVHEKAMESSLDADELKKVSEALQKTANTWLLLQGKATAISESHSKDAVDLGLVDLLNAHRVNESSRDLDTRSSST